MRSPAVLITLALAACDSPEAHRTRGGGPGGDTGNRPQVLRMHEGSRPFHHIPHQTGVDSPALEDASQAREYGRR